MYRPKNWDNPLTKERLLKAHNDFEDVGKAFESGADAMLRAVIEEFEKSGCYKIVNDNYLCNPHKFREFWDSLSK